MSAALDTLQMVKRLKEAGFNDAQAEAVTNVVRDVRAGDFSLLATKADVERLAADVERLAATTKADLDRLAATTKSDLAAAIAEVKTDIIKWIVGVGFAQVAMILGVLKLFPGAHP